VAVMVLHVENRQRVLSMQELAMWQKWLWYQQFWVDKFVRFHIDLQPYPG
jgi:hypothetical protein